MGQQSKETPSTRLNADAPASVQNNSWMVGASQKHLFSLTRRFFSHASHYTVLGISQTASAIDVKQSYYALVRKHHPDNFGQNEPSRRTAEAKIKSINAAYRVLSNPHARLDYDKTLHPASSSSASAAAAAAASAATASATQGFSDYHATSHGFAMGPNPFAWAEAEFSPFGEQTRAAEANAAYEAAHGGPFAHNGEGFGYGFFDPSHFSHYRSGPRPEAQWADFGDVRGDSWAHRGGRNGGGFEDVEPNIAGDGGGGRRRRQHRAGGRDGGNARDFDLDEETAARIGGLGPGCPPPGSAEFDALMRDAEAAGADPFLLFMGRVFGHGPDEKLRRSSAADKAARAAQRRQRDERGKAWFGDEAVAAAARGHASKGNRGGGGSGDGRNGRQYGGHDVRSRDMSGSHSEADDDTFVAFTARAGRMRPARDHEEDLAADFGVPPDFELGRADGERGAAGWTLNEGNGREQSARRRPRDFEPTNGSDGRKTDPRGRNHSRNSGSARDQDAFRQHYDRGQSSTNSDRGRSGNGSGGYGGGNGRGRGHGGGDGRGMYVEFDHRGRPRFVEVSERLHADATSGRLDGASVSRVLGDFLSEMVAAGGDSKGANDVNNRRGPRHHHHSRGHHARPISSSENDASTATMGGRNGHIFGRTTSPSPPDGAPHDYGATNSSGSESAFDLPPKGSEKLASPHYRSGRGAHSERSHRAHSRDAITSSEPSPKKRPLFFDCQETSEGPPGRRPLVGPRDLAPTYQPGKSGDGVLDACGPEYATLNQSGGLRRSRGQNAVRTPMTDFEDDLRCSARAVNEIRAGDVDNVTGNTISPSARFSRLQELRQRRSATAASKDEASSADPVAAEQSQSATAS